jgi:hypothetical protein
MSETVAPAIVDAVNQSQLATMAPQVVLTGGAGKAYALAAQAAAIAVQDAVDALRGAATTANAASGAALAQFLASGDPRYLEALPQAQALVKNAIDNFAATGAAASAVLKSFPSG